MSGANIQAFKIAVSLVIINPIIINLWYVWQNTYHSFASFPLKGLKHSVVWEFFYCESVSWNFQLWNLWAIFRNAIALWYFRIARLYGFLYNVIIINFFKWKWKVQDSMFYSIFKILDFFAVFNFNHYWILIKVLSASTLHIKVSTVLGWKSTN